MRFPGAAALLLMAGNGIAQDDVVSPEQQTEIREYVVKQKAAPVELPSDFQLSVGSTAPDTVELNAVEVPDVKYRYVVVADRTVLVEPTTRKSSTLCSDCGRPRAPQASTTLTTRTLEGGRDEAP